MRTSLGLALVSLLTAPTVSAYNETVKTITVTSWSTIDLCPAPTTTTVILCNAECATSTFESAANIVYQTTSDCQAGQVVTISGGVTTLAQATTLTLKETVSNLVVVPDAVTNNNYTASVTIDSTVYASSLTASSGEVVTCQTGTTTISSDGVVLTNCPCTVQTTILELTATGMDTVPTAVVSSSNYIVKIVYLYVVQYITESISTQVTATATSTLTTIQIETATQTATNIATTTVSSTPRPSMVTVDRVVFLLDYDTSVDGSAAGDTLRKRQAGNLPDISGDLYACVSQCATEQDCVAFTFVENNFLCRPLVQFDAASSRNASGVVFGTVIFRPASLSSAQISSSSSASIGRWSIVGSGVASGSSVTTTSSSRRSTDANAPSSSSIITAPGSSSRFVTTSSNSISPSSNQSGSKSVLYPISNSTSSLSSTFSSSSYVSVSDPSISSTRSSSTLSSNTVSSTSSRTTSPSIVITSSSSSSTTNSSATLPVSNSSTPITTSSAPLTVSTDGCSFDDPALDIFTDESHVSEANAFCSSYLEIPAVTETAYSTSTNYRITNTTITLTSYSTITEQLPDATVTDVSTEVDFETVTITTSVPLVAPQKRGVTSGVATSTAIPFASQVATISASLISAGCSCIQSRIPISTTTSTLQQQLTLAGPNITATSTVQELVTTQAQSTTTVESVTTSTSYVTSTSSVQVREPYNANCAGAICSNYKYCGSGCLCATSAEGLGYCISGRTSCSSPGCSTSADCSGSQVCVVGTCCQRSLCAELACSNPGLLLPRLAKKGLVRTIADGW